MALAIQKPTYQESGCPLCVKRTKGRCNRCGDPIPNDNGNKDDIKRVGVDILKYKNMGGNGFQSITPTHYHFSNKLPGAPSVVQDELCLGCYRTDFSETYPNAECPV